MAGPARALNTVGGQVTWQATAFGAIVAGLMSMFLVGRHTRAEEESGRDELVRASAVGRRAPLTATVVELVLANTLLGGLVAVSLVAVPLAVADSLALGVGVGLCGLAFGGVALVAAQLTSTTRAAYGLTGAVIAAAYALRAVGDVGDEALSWVEPDRLVPADVRLLRSPVVARPAARGARDRDDPRGVRRVRAARHRLRCARRTPGTGAGVPQPGVAGRPGVAAAARLRGRLGAGPGVHRVSRTAPSATAPVT